MSTPSPLIPQGTFQAQANKGASNVRIAVATIVAIHVVFFGGLLLQGCKRDTKTGELASAETNTVSTNLSLPPIDTQYYSNATHLPNESTGSLFTSPPPSSVTETIRSNTSTAIRDTLAPSGSGVTPLPADPALKEYVVARGDTYAKIAAANGTTVNALKKANASIDPAKLRPGMKLQVPAATPASAVTSTAGGVPTPVTATENAGAPQPGGGRTYTVKGGDTLTKVAKAHNISVSQLRAANSLKTSGLKVGQKLKIPASTPSTNTAVKPTAKKAVTNQVTL